jgi:hypothetical protein
MRYVGIDGDDVGAKLELFLLQNDEDGIKSLSNSIDATISGLASKALELKIEIIFFAGDSLLCKGEESRLDELLTFLYELQPKRVSFSAGIGVNLKDAYIALKFAKASGKNRIILLEEENYSLWKRT